MLNVLLIGNGGREHALALSLSKSSALKKLYCAPGNPGIAKLAKLVDLDVTNHQTVVDFCREAAIGLVVIGPEAPLVAGLADDLAQADIKAFGPSRAAAQLEGSKGFTKELCREAGIPTAAYERFTDSAAAKNYIGNRGAPIVIKADGLAAGKGVTVAMTEEEAAAAVDACFAGAFGTAGAGVVIEDYLEGEEVSFFALSDGEHILPLTSAQDHKRAFDGDAGPNTGGMGAYSPAPILTPALEQQVIERIIQPTVSILRARGTPYRGVLYAGLMLTKNGPQLIEYNCRFGDPEAQVILPRLDGDIIELMLACIGGTLDKMKARWRNEHALTVVLAAKGYPTAPQKGALIPSLFNAEKMDGVIVFHAGTALKDGGLVATGGRVLDVTAFGRTLGEAQAKAYAAVDQIGWQEGFCRRDIGWRALKAGKRYGT
jgi:phosphoribosylamine--glycine ligase